MDLSGVLIPAATPFDPATGEVDLEALEVNLDRWLQAPVRGIVIGGSTGEAVLLDRDERAALLDRARDEVPQDRLLIAGTGAESTRETLRLTRDAAEREVSAVLVQPPAYYKGQMTPEVLRDHYRAVADASPVPVILYQVPLRFSTVELATGLVAELSEHENVVGIKDSRGDLEVLGGLVTSVRKGFQVLVGSGANLYASLEVGAVGGILGVANLLPAEAAQVHAAFAQGRGAEAGRAQEVVGPVHNRVVARLGVPGVKTGLELMGLPVGPPRPPLRPLDADDVGVVRDALERAGALAPVAGEAPLDRNVPETGG
jgi:4-hydroxy-2-oxoglutarate aldolase